MADPFTNFSNKYAPLAPDVNKFSVDELAWIEGNFIILKEMYETGADGSFVSNDGKTITVRRGLITEIS